MHLSDRPRVCDDPGMADSGDPSTAPLESPFEPLRWIGSYKIAKGVLALIGGLLLLRLMHRSLPELADHWMGVLHIEPQGELGKLILTRILAIKKGNMGWAAIGLFAYVPLACIEGIGLMLRKVWAEWITLATTTALIPVEVHEVLRRLTWVRVVILTLNIAVAIYLIVRLHHDRKRRMEIARSSANKLPE
jgi:uncharacterized membrane protein (DUF2068 family)